MDNLISYLVTEKNISRCREQYAYELSLLAKSLKDVADEICYADLIYKADNLDSRHIEYFRLSMGDFKYFKMALVRIFEGQQLQHFMIEPRRSSPFG